jgi:F-type H+-transporting ATPase subunit b
MKKLFLLQLLMIPAVALAAPKGDGTIADLISPAVNFTLLFGFLGYKLKKPLSNMFTKKAEDISSLVAHAEEKDKEATIKFEMYSKKLAGLTHEREKLVNEAIAEGNAFDQAKAKETKETLVKLEKDAASKVENEKRAMLKELSNEVVESVIAKTKEKVVADKNIQSKTTHNLVSNF